MHATPRLDMSLDCKGGRKAEGGTIQTGQLGGAHVAHQDDLIRTDHVIDLEARAAIGWPRSSRLLCVIVAFGIDR